MTETGVSEGTNCPTCGGGVDAPSVGKRWMIDTWEHYLCPDPFHVLSEEQET